MIFKKDIFFILFVANSLIHCQVQYFPSSLKLLLVVFTTTAGETLSVKQQRESVKAHNSKNVTAGDVMKSFTHLLSDAVVVPTERLPIVDVLYLFSADQVAIFIYFSIMSAKCWYTMCYLSW